VSSTPFTLNIERLRLNLPRGYAQRAGSIARHVGDELARRPLSAGRSFAALRVSAPALPHGLSDQQVAARIADAVHARILEQA